MSYHVLVLGSGGREHALCYALSHSDKVSKIYCATGNAGISDYAACVALDIENPKTVFEFCQENHINFVVIGSEAPAAAGVGDMLREHNILVFGPNQQAAALEASKSFTKDICQKLNMPTARYYTAHNLSDALNALQDFDAPYVLKADGLAAGKGVIIAPDLAAAQASLRNIFQGDIFQGAFAQAGHKVVLEEHLTGPEVSFFVISDGKNILPFGTAQDHKRAYDGDQGPNTGGMGAYSPASIMTPQIEHEVIQRIIQPVIREMHDNNMPFVGVLYAGLMLTPDGPKLIEFNVRFGDPECQILMMRLKSDLFSILHAAASGNLGSCPKPEFSDDYVVTVVMAANGYPGKNVTKGTKISLPSQMADNTMIFHAGTVKNADGQLVANGGRVLNITATGSDIQQATQRAYDLAAQIDWPESFYRKDIAYQEIQRQK